MNDYWHQIEAFYSNFEPWNYKYELGNILNEVNDIVSDGKYSIRNKPEDYYEIIEKLQTCISQFNACQKDYKRGVLKRVFSSTLIRGMIVVLLSITVLFLVA